MNEVPRCPDELLASNLSDVQVRVWLAVRKVQGDNASAYCAFARYGEMTGKTEAQVSKAIKKLVKEGWIVRKGRNLSCVVATPNLASQARQNEQVADTDLASQASKVASQARSLASQATPSNPDNNPDNNPLDDDVEEARASERVVWKDDDEKSRMAALVDELADEYRGPERVDVLFVRLVTRESRRTINRAWLIEQAQRLPWPDMIVCLLHAANWKGDPDAFLQRIVDKRVRLIKAGPNAAAVPARPEQVRHGTGPPGELPGVRRDGAVLELLTAGLLDESRDVDEQVRAHYTQHPDYPTRWLPTSETQALLQRSGGRLRLVG